MILMQSLYCFSINFYLKLILSVHFVVKTFSICRVIEVFTWLLEVANDTKEHWDGGRIVWSVSYVHDGPKIKDMPLENTNGTPEETRRKLVAKLEIQKDDIQAVLPISKVCYCLRYELRGGNH